jgi:hypothetical protein
VSLPPHQQSSSSSSYLCRPRWQGGEEGSLWTTGAEWPRNLPRAGEDSTCSAVALSGTTILGHCDGLAAFGHCGSSLLFLHSGRILHCLGAPIDIVVDPSGLIPVYRFGWAMKSWLGCMMKIMLVEISLYRESYLRT